MNSLAKEFRDKSEGLTQASNNILASGELTVLAGLLFAADPTDADATAAALAAVGKFVNVINARTAALIGKVNATTYSIMADMLEYLDAKHNNGNQSEQLQGIVRQASAARLAAARGVASGDWSEFDRLVRPQTDSSPAGGSGAAAVDSGGQQP